MPEERSFTKGDEMKTSNLKPCIKLTIENPHSGSGSALGPGVAALCDGVRETGSLNAAAKDMGMAYSKAWRIMKETEAALGVQLLVRDGAHGSTLTPDAIKILDSYYALRASLQERGETEFKKMLTKK